MRANVIIEKGTTDRRLVHKLKNNRSVLWAGAVIFVSYYYLCRMCIRHRSRWVQSSRLQWNPKYSLAKPSFPVNTLSSFYVIRGLQMSMVNSNPRKFVRYLTVKLEIHPESSDHILTLSTCTGNGYDSRMTVHAVCIDEQTTDPEKLFWNFYQDEKTLMQIKTTWAFFLFFFFEKSRK